MPSLFHSSSRRREKTAPPISSPVEGSFSHPVSLSSKDLDRSGSLAQPEKGHLRAATVPATPLQGLSQKTGEFGTLPAPKRHSKQNVSQTHSRKQARASGSTSTAHPTPARHTTQGTELASANTVDAARSVRYSHHGASRSSGQHNYGLLGNVGGDVLLGHDDVEEILRLVGEELRSRGLETPLLFSNQSLEVDHVQVRLLIEQYMVAPRTKNRSSSDSDRQTIQADLRYNDVRTLAWFLRWALSRLHWLAVDHGEWEKGLVDWEVYEEWRGQERAAAYPASAYGHLASLMPTERFAQLLTPLLALLSRFAAHSHISGLTPHALASLFGPLIFDVPLSAPALVAHVAFIRAAYATEHLLLAYIRSSGHRDGLGIDDLPGRLKLWVKGYPGMVASDAVLAKGEPRRGARVIRCERASRTVRAYSKDLILSAEQWVDELPPDQKWATWDRLVLRDKHRVTSTPRFTDGYRAKLAMPDTPVLGSAPVGHATGSTHQGTSQVALDTGLDQLRWESVAGKEWSAFAEGGFDSPVVKRASGLGKGPGADNTGQQRRGVAGGSSIAAILQFDLNESKKLSWAERRRTMDWTDFAASTGGFTRTDGSLAASLSFSAPVEQSIEAWPADSAELRRRLVKSQKEAVAFSYDTAPRFGKAVIEQDDPHSRPDEHGRLYVEEAFIDFWADLGLGAGWIETDELTFRESNWAFVEYKARPARPDPDLHPSNDPRTSELYVLFEERVPPQYQEAVANPQQKRTFASLFSPKKKQRPVESAGARPARLGEKNEFDQMLRRPSQTRKISATKQGEGAAIWHRTRSEYTPGSPTKRERPGGDRRKSDDSAATERLKDGHNFFVWAKGHSGGSTDENGSNRERPPGIKDLKHAKDKQKWEEVEFELNSASGASSGGESQGGSGVPKDKWMDILIANGARPMDRAETSPPVTSSTAQLSPHCSPRSPPALGPPISPATRSPFVVRSRPPPGATEELNGGSNLAGIASDLKDRHPQQSSDETQPEDVLVTPRRATFRQLPQAPDAAQRETAYTYDSYSSTSPVSSLSTPEFPVRKPVSPHAHARLPEHVKLPPPNPKEDVDAPPMPVPKDSAEIHQPRPYRDTVMSVVDRYDYTDESDESPPVPHFEPQAYGLTVPPPPERVSICSATTASSVGRSSLDDTRSDVRVYDSEETRDELRPLEGPVFDLTPGREPSPARYKHGEPLQLVGEEEEEE